jgi:thiamine pyrophosphokinase
MNKKCVIVSGGSIDDSFAMQMIENIKPDCVIGVDSGLNFLYRNQVVPTHIVGDFDSVSPEVINYYKAKADIPIREFDPVKDATDTEIAVHLASELGVKELFLLGATGTRLDHVMANVQILKIALDQGMRAYILDECNRISVWKKEIRLCESERFGKYFSLFPLGGDAPDVSIEGAKYPLEHYRMSPFESRCVSNEYKDDEVVIMFPKGTIVLMETRDKE